MIIYGIFNNLGAMQTEKVSSIIFNLIFMSKLCIYLHFFSFVSL